MYLQLTTHIFIIIPLTEQEQGSYGPSVQRQPVSSFGEVPIFLYLSLILIVTIATCILFVLTAPLVSIRLCSQKLD